MPEVSANTQEDATGAEVMPPLEEETAVEGETAVVETEQVDDELGGANDADVRFAKENGWAPKQDWRGDPAKYETAKDFADRARGINSLLQKKLSRQDQTIAQLQRDFQQLMEGKAKNDLRELDQKISDVRARRVEAINQGDGKSVDDAERELSRLDSERRGVKIPQAAPPNGIDALNASDQTAAREWESRNPWINDNPRLARLAKTITEEIREDRRDLVGNVSGFLAELETRIKRDYPEQFTGMRHARTDGGTAQARAPLRAKKHSYESLPKEAQEACDRLMRSGMIRKREDYVKNYAWDD